MFSHKAILSLYGAFVKTSRGKTILSDTRRGL